MSTFSTLSSCQINTNSFFTLAQCSPKAKTSLKTLASKAIRGWLSSLNVRPAQHKGFHSKSVVKMPQTWMEFSQKSEEEYQVKLKEAIEINSMSMLSFCRRVSGGDAVLKEVADLSLHRQTSELSNWLANDPSIESIVHLDLSNAGLTVLPSSVECLVGLKSLDLSYNSLSTLPSAIRTLKKLERFTAAHNKIVGLPKELFLLVSLRRLDLSDNLLFVIPSGIGNLANLTELVLDGNQLVSVAFEIGHLKCLQELWLNENALTLIPDEMGNLKQLTLLNLADNYLSRIPAHIGNLLNLKFLFLRSNRICSLPEEITKLSKSCTIDICNNPISRPLKRAIVLNGSVIVDVSKAQDTVFEPRASEDSQDTKTATASKSASTTTTATTSLASQPTGKK